MSIRGKNLWEKGKINARRLAQCDRSCDWRATALLDFQQMSVMVDLLRNEKPINFGWYQETPNLFQLMTGAEAVGEGDGFLALR